MKRHKGQPIYKPRLPALPPNKRHRDRKNDYQRQSKHKHKEERTS